LIEQEHLVTFENPTGPQQGYQQPGYQQQGYQQPGHPQAGYPQAGYPQAGHPQPGQPAWSGQPAQIDAQQERTWGSASHWSTILLGFLGPLLIMLTKGNESPFVRRQATEALNFQLTLIIGYFASFILMFVLIGFLTFFAFWVAGIAFAIMGAIKANNGEDYRYPVAIRLVK
jgi:uncharacterized protein